MGYVIVVHPSVPVKTIPEFIAYAKANPGKINYGSAGPGTPGTFACELFKMMAGRIWFTCRIAAVRLRSPT